ncbi:ABC transporter ATP-binding protein [Microbacterium sp. SORGH_AS_0888]|uniref:ABC transporter ATP-binding protein n=1 Tax=Microbacterium sp. SORGH_AS_0888 TaxID=3041791 RepID=UPI00278A3E63|nr:ABC transporter ATP-binding protein [Microbacterium sp. SORGH_AS_0888]MDQ1131007.1 branched-chain amino acid transport system ATP-binding protein [Microbacterium sp. SORGH_AS_0888]
MSELILDAVRIEREGRSVVRDVNLVARSGEVTLLLGSNGAGKTTLLEGVSGVIPIAGGTVALDGAQLNRLSVFRRTRLGLAHVQEGRSVFGPLTVEENLRVTGGASDIARAYDLFPELVEKRTTPAAQLSGGQQQMLVIARALAQRPAVLMIDELSLGLAPKLVTRLLKAVRSLADDGLAIILVEQYAHLALTYGDRAYLFARGSVAHELSCAELIDQPDLLRAVYLDT